MSELFIPKPWPSRPLLGGLIATIAVLAYWTGPGLRSTEAQSHPQEAELFQRLHSQKTTDGARIQLLQLAKSEPSIKRGLAVQLPLLIEAGPNSCPQNEIIDLEKRWHSCPWFNAVELAGNLKIAEAAPALTRWISWRSSSIIVGLSSEARLDFLPAAKALAQIGDAAIAAVQDVLNHGNSDERAKAVRVLCIVHSPEAKAALRDDLEHERDPDLQAMIKRELAQK